MLQAKMKQMFFSLQSSVTAVAMLFVVSIQFNTYSISLSNDTVGAFNDSVGKFPGFVTIRNNGVQEAIIDSMKLRMLNCKELPENEYIEFYTSTSNGSYLVYLNIGIDSVYLPMDGFPPPGFLNMNILPGDSFELSDIALGYHLLSFSDAIVFTEFSFRITLYTIDGDSVSFVCISPYKTNINPSEKSLVVKERLAFQQNKICNLLGRQCLIKGSNNIIIYNRVYKQVNLKQPRQGTKKN